MKRRTTGFMLLLLVFLTAVLSGCGKEQEEASEYSIYYVNKDKTKIVSEGYEPKAENTQGMIREMLKQLSKDTESPDYRKAMGKDVEIKSWNLDNSQLYLYFNMAYQEMDHVTEILCRAAIVRTLIQIEGIDYISFYVGDTPLADGNGNLVGLMTADSFIENPGEQINSIQTASITLYFASKDGNRLMEEVQEVRYSTNISMEKLVMEYLLKGPRDKNLRSAIPMGTKLIGVSVLDGICFVNLDEGFMNQNYEITEPVVIYSIVNSLVELPNINKVQIAVNGDSNKIYRDLYDLGNMYERNLDYLDGSAKTGEEQMKEAEIEPDILEEAGGEP